MPTDGFDAFREFIEHQMLMQAVYQPVMIRKLLDMGGKAPRSTIAHEIWFEDLGRMGNPRAYEGIVKDLPGKVLESRHWVTFDEDVDEYNLTADLDNITEDELDILTDACNRRIRAYREGESVQPTRERRYYSLFANPRIYRVEDAIQSLSHDFWVTRGRDFAPGDRLIIWRGVGSDGHRGVVGFGQIVGPTRVTADIGNPYWVDQTSGEHIEERVLIQYFRLEHGPLWIDQHPTLGSLSVSRARGGTVFNVSAEEWGEVIELAGGWPLGNLGLNSQQELDGIQQETEVGGDFDSDGIEDARTRTFRSIVLRRGQRDFRRELLEAYGRKCAVTAYDSEFALEACHIFPYQGPDTNHVTNGLLLRSDIHTLFDLGMMAVDTSDMTLILADGLLRSSYAEFSKKPITLPRDPSKRPSTAALDQHRQLVGL